MKTRQLQLWIHDHYGDIKHWLIIIVGFILVVFAMVSYANQNRLLDRVATLSQQNKSLSEQNRRLNQENKSYAKETQGVVLQNRSYIKCLSNIFAQYTHDFVPITIENLEQCTTQSGGTFGNSLQANSSSSSSVFHSSPNNTPSSKSAQPNNSQPGGNPSSPQPVKVLGIPVCVPLTGVCVRQ